MEDDISESSDYALSDRIYALLLKNVSKDQPLTESELLELKEFRMSLNNEDWKYWLKFARQERKRLIAEGIALPYVPEPETPSGNPQGWDASQLPPQDQQAPPAAYFTTAPQESYRYEGDNYNPHVVSVSAEEHYTSYYHHSDQGARGVDGIGPSIFHLTSQELPDEPTQTQPSLHSAAGALASAKPHHSYPSPVAPNRGSSSANSQRGARAAASSPSPDIRDGVSLHRPPQRSRSAPRAGMIASSSSTQVQQKSTAHPQPPQPPTQPHVLQRSPPQAVLHPTSHQPSLHGHPSQHPPAPSRAVANGGAGKDSTARSGVGLPGQPQPTPSATLIMQPARFPSSQFESDPHVQTHGSKLGRVVSSQSSPPRSSTPQFSAISSSQQLHAPKPSSHEPVETYSSAANHGRASPLQGIMSAFEPQVSVSSQQQDDDLRSTLLEAAELARAGSDRIHAAYSAANYLMKTMVSGKFTEGTSREILVEMMSCLEKARSSLEHLEASATATVQPSSATPHVQHPSSRPVHKPLPTQPAPLPGSLRYQDLREDPYDVPVSETHSEWDEMQQTPQAAFRHSLTNNFKPTSPWRSLLRGDVPNSFPANPAYAERAEPHDPFGMEAADAFPPTPPVTDLIASNVHRGKVYTVQGSLVTRVCIVQGPLAKAFEEFPIRADLESASVDVVWREPRNHDSAASLSGSLNQHTPNYANSTFSSRRSQAQTPLGSNNLHQRGVKPPFGSTEGSENGFMVPQTLRRERFFFDTVLAGAKAPQRLRALVKQSTRNAIAAAMNLVVVCTGCGEVAPLEVEPPVTLALGSAGGSGVVSAMLDEIFKYTASTTYPSGTADIFPTANGSEYVAAGGASAVQSSRLSRVTFSAVLVSGHSAVDLLNTNSPTAGQRGSPGEGVRIVLDQKTRRANLRGATWVDLQSTMDFERIVGLLLGRRTGLLEALHSGNMSATTRDFAALATWDSGGAATGGGGGGGMDDQASTWSAPSSHHPATAASRASASRLHGRVLNADRHGIHAVSDEPQSTVLVISIAISCTPVYSRKAHRLVFRVAAPCGQNWTQPGFDLNAFSEVLGSWPHEPPMSILQASPLTALLTDQPMRNGTSFLSLLSVSRKPPGQGRPTTPSKYGEQTTDHDYGAAMDWELASSAVQALRIASLPK